MSSKDSEDPLHGKIYGDSSLSELILPKVRALFFDVDGTLCDSASLHYQAWFHVACKLEIPVPSWQDYVKECLRGQRRFEDLLDLKRVASSAILSLHETKSHVFRQLALASLKPFAGVTEMWSRAHALGLRVAVVSTARRRSVENILDILHLPFPDLVIAREDVEPHVKPDPAGYRLAAKGLRLSPLDCVAFEDSPSGIQAAVSAEVQCLAMASPVFTIEEQSRALLLLDSLNDVELTSSGENVVKLLARGTAF